MSKKKVLLRGVFINRDTNGEGVLKVGTTLIRVSTVMGILYMYFQHTDISRVVFEGYVDDDEIMMCDNIVNAMEKTEIERADVRKLKRSMVN